MNQHHHDTHQQGHHKKSRGLHQDWRAWVAVALMLGAMLMYVLSDDESIQPGADMAPGAIDSAPVEAAP